MNILDILPESFHQFATKRDGKIVLEFNEDYHLVYRGEKRWGYLEDCGPVIVKRMWLKQAAGWVLDFMQMDYANNIEYPDDTRKEAKARKLSMEPLRKDIQRLESAWHDAFSETKKAVKKKLQDSSGDPQTFGGITPNHTLAAWFIARAEKDKTPITERRVITLVAMARFHQENQDISPDIFLPGNGLLHLSKQGEAHNRIVTLKDNVSSGFTLKNFSKRQREYLDSIWDSYATA